MARTLNDAIWQARQILEDAREPYRNSDTQLLAYLNTALEDAFRLRPDLFLPDISTSLPFYTIDQLSTAFPLEAGFFSPVVDYIVGYRSMADDEFVNDQRALSLLNRFTQKLTSKGA